MFRFLSLILAILMSVVKRCIAVYYNKIPLSLIDFHIIQFSDIPLGVFLFLSMMFGVLYLNFFFIGIIFSLRKKYRVLKKDHESD
jgi:uncharacterized integral membrane protein